MSAESTPVLSPQPAGMPPLATRPRLRLVGPQERLGHDGYAQVPGTLATSLTRRGRLAITVASVMAVMAVAVLAMALAASVDAAGSRSDIQQIDHATVVSAGQTLSEVAAAQLPSLPINDAMARIQLANGLNTVQVQAGQVLLIPALS